MVIRRATPEDAGGIVSVIEVVAAERKFSAIDRPWTVEEERRYVESLSAREAIHIAVDHTGAIAGLQILDRWSPLDSMSHVGTLGTFLLPAWRRRGIGQRLWDATRGFAREAAYRKLLIFVRASNSSAQSFYRGLGFSECGRLSRQTIIDGVADDEIMMELHLS
jgi:ribosomal protein S18 acetylase RimI-like enzyme